MSAKKQLDGLFNGLIILALGWLFITILDLVLELGWGGKLSVAAALERIPKFGIGQGFRTPGELGVGGRVDVGFSF